MVMLPGRVVSFLHPCVGTDGRNGAASNHNAVHLEIRCVFEGASCGGGGQHGYGSVPQTAPGPAPRISTQRGGILCVQVGIHSVAALCAPRHRCSRPYYSVVRAKHHSEETHASRLLLVMVGSARQESRPSTLDSYRFLARPAPPCVGLPTAPEELTQAGQRPNRSWTFDIFTSPRGQGYVCRFSWCFPCLSTGDHMRIVHVSTDLAESGKVAHLLGRGPVNAKMVRRRRIQGTRLLGKKTDQHFCGWRYA